MSRLCEAHHVGYTCVAQSHLGIVYLPESAQSTIDIDLQTTNDVAFHPKTNANEVLLTPVISITPHNGSLSTDQPAIIELMRNVQLLDIGDHKIVHVPMCSSTDQSVPPNWEELDVECDVLEDRIRFKMTHFSYFSVIARFSPPTATVTVDPNVSDTEGQVQLTVPELPGFKVEIPSKSVQSATEVKATLHYDDFEVCRGSFSQPLASASVHLEPHGMQFSEKNFSSDTHSSLL